MLKKLSNYFVKLRHRLSVGWKAFVGFWRGGWRHKLVVILVALFFVILSSMYGIARWYVASQQGSQRFGVTFIPAYAESLDLDAQETMSALIYDMNVRNFRLVSYWDRIEPQMGQYDFKELDWQFKAAEKVHAKISLSIGLRQPRWPECHAPAWSRQVSYDQWYSSLMQYITEVVQRYQNSPSLESYQLENEFALKAFGECTNYDRSRLIDEFNMVKNLDSKHPIIISRSNNFPAPLLSQPRPDIVGFSIYRRVWDGAFTHRYFTYPIPSWYFAFQAGVQKILTGKDSIVHELQAEAWPPNGKSIRGIELAEQNKTFDAKRLKRTVKYGRNTGMPQIYLWGAEYWYYRKVNLHDPTVWQTARQIFANQPK
jgi:hypothetical protein